MEVNEKLALLEETLDMEAGSLTADMQLSDVEEFDSIGKLSLIVMMDDEFGKIIKSDDIQALVTVQDILDIMEWNNL